MSKKCVFWIVLDSFGIGALPDAALFGDEGSDTLSSCAETGKLNLPNLVRLGLGNIDGVSAVESSEAPAGAFGRLSEKSRGKDTTTGHWELSGLVSEEPFPTFPDGFPKEVMALFAETTGKEALCGLPYSGTAVIRDYGEEHLKTGKPIVYTSADSVFQIAAHEEVIPPEELYALCRKMRAVLRGKYGVGRVIARPFAGKAPDFFRTAGRHDFSLEPPRDTALDILKENGLSVIGVGKIGDIFAGKGLTESLRTGANAIGMKTAKEVAARDFEGLCFINLVDFDSNYGHRRNAAGYAAALSDFDGWLGGFTKDLREDDLLMITADHGCDPAFPGTDHTREYIPLLVYGKKIKPGADLGTRDTFADEGKTVLDYFGLKTDRIAGKSFLDKMI